MSARERAILVVKQLRQKGYEAFFAGGCVRDMLLNKTAQDYDIATSARPEDIQRVFAETIPVGAYDVSNTPRWPGPYATSGRLLPGLFSPE